MHEHNHQQSGAEREAIALLGTLLTDNPLSQDALPPVFADSHIAEAYQTGCEYASRLDAEIDDVMRPLLPSLVKPAFPIAVTDSEALAHLNAIVLIQNGEALPMLDIERIVLPFTQGQKARLYTATARMLLDAVAAILDERAATIHHEQHPVDDEDDGEQESGVLC